MHHIVRIGTDGSDAPQARAIRSELTLQRLEAIEDLEGGYISPAITLGEYLHKKRYGEAFMYRYILPMGCAIWSASTERMIDFPLRFFVQFFKNHGLLSVNDRPQWHVIKGGSRSYLDPLIADFRHSIHTGVNINRCNFTTFDFFGQDNSKNSRSCP